MLKIHEWTEIKAEFTKGLIIGNGASIAVWPEFDYHSIFKEATKHKGSISSKIKKVFESFNTRDFELVLRLLWHATLVNDALKLQDDETAKAYKNVRKALIKTVSKIHPAYCDVSSYLSDISDFLRNFKIVASLNYDLIVYWAMLIRKDNWLKDCFINEKFKTDWEPMLRKYGRAKGATLVFYPHGNLSLAKDMYDEERKIQSSNGNNLLDKIILSWKRKREKLIPIFVSEGTSERKLKAIERSPYLRTVYDMILPKLGENIVIYGWKMGDQDSHILKALAKGKVSKIAVSIHKPSVNLQKKASYFSDRIHEFFKNEQNVEVKFFDSKSKGCWITPGCNYNR